MNEQAVGWAVHALEPDEEIAVLRHLPLCASCRAVVADAEDVLTRLGSAVEQVEPPPALRASLMSRVAQTPQLSAAIPNAHGGEAPPAPKPAASARPGPSRPPGGRPPREGRSFLSRRGRRLVAASIALVGVLAIGGLVIRTAQLEQQRDAELAQARSMSQLLDQLGRPDTRYALLAEEGGPTVAAVLVADGRRQVYSLALPQNSTDRDTYVLWGIGSSGTPSPLNTFDVVSDEPGVRAVAEVSGAEEFGQYAISIEPGRVAPSTPTTVVAVGAVAA